MQLQRLPEPGERLRKIAKAAVLVSYISCKDEQPKEYDTPRSEKTMPALTNAPIVDVPKSAVPAQQMQAPQTLNPKPEKQKPATDRGCKENMSRIGRFCIDRFEIVLEGKDGTRFRHNMHPPEHMSGLKAVSLGGMNPQGHLSAPQAGKACENAGKRLCTSDEWEAACKGGDNSFPYGAVVDGSKCNVDKREPHILDYYFPEIPHLQRTGKQFNDPLLLLDPAYQTKAGEKIGCVTASGVFDMDGNMSEWVSDTSSKGNITLGTFRGAPFSGHAHEGCARKTTTHDARYYDYSLSTRCCSEVSR
jgi:hypothetical protein